MFGHVRVVQSTHKISGDAAVGFATYLTATNSRGDYYTGGEVGAAENDAVGVVGGGRWHGSSEALGRLGLGPDARVHRGELLALMRGVSPRTGEPVRRAGGDGSRVAGIDMTFSAPKSLSALWAVSGPYRRAQIEAAHRGAVTSAVDRVQGEVAVVRRREDGGAALGARPEPGGGTVRAHRQPPYPRSGAGWGA